MAEKLLQYYKYVSKEKGIAGKTMLAKATKIPSPVAAVEPDSLEKIKLFKSAVESITGRPAPNF